MALEVFGEAVVVRGQVVGISKETWSKNSWAPEDDVGPKKKRKKAEINGRGKETEDIEGSKNSVKKDQFRTHLLLHKAALEGNWRDAELFFGRNEGALTASINEYSQTALHVAVGTGKNIHFVQKLVGLVSQRDLSRMLDKSGNTALNVAAKVGNTDAAKILVQEYRDLLYVANNAKNLPVSTAARHAQKDTLLYLLSVTKFHPLSPSFSGQSGAQLLKRVIFCGFYDVALNLVHRYPDFAKEKDGGQRSALGKIATHESAFRSGSRLSYWQRLIYYYVHVELEDYANDQYKVDIEGSSSEVTAQKYIWNRFSGNFSICVPYIQHVQEKKLMHLQALQLVRCLCKEISSVEDFDFSISFAKDALLAAIRHGIHEVVEEIVRTFPSLVWTRDSENRNIFQLAVGHRHENVFNLIYQMSNHKKLNVDKSRNTILHYAGKLAPSHKLNFVSGEALQMQRELQWFQEVEKLANPAYPRFRNKNFHTPAMVFSNEHKKLVAKGEKWMKDTATSCTIVAALIVTVVFAAAITVPGGNNGASGLPILSKERAFTTFAVSDAISLFTSATSLLMFLSILTSRYAEADFLYALPKRLIIGLVTLFLSITSMMVAFSSTLYLVFGQNKAWIVIPVAALACFPITSFMFLQFPLLVDLISSTYGRSIFSKQSDKPFY